MKEFLDSTGKWVYADVQHEMKNTYNELKANYLGSDDGVHLTPEAYYAILYQLCERMVDGKIYDPADGLYTDAEEGDIVYSPEETKRTRKTTTEDTEPETIENEISVTEETEIS